jgi:hypothetical protein
MAYTVNYSAGQDGLTDSANTKMKNEANKALEPTTMPVTFRAYARTAPGMVAAQFLR